MSYPNGPVSTVPESKTQPAMGAKCDKHPLLSSVATIQGETDSMGAEYIEVCQKCYDKYTRHGSIKTGELSNCEWCGSKTRGCKPTRDPEEGFYGTLYNVCPTCRSKQVEVIHDTED